MYDWINLLKLNKEICVSMETYRYDVRSRPNTREQREGPPFRDIPVQLTSPLVPSLAARFLSLLA